MIDSLERLRESVLIKKIESACLQLNGVRILYDRIFQEKTVESILNVYDSELAREKINTIENYINENLKELNKFLFPKLAHLFLFILKRMLAFALMILDHSPITVLFLKSPLYRSGIANFLRIGLFFFVLFGILFLFFAFPQAHILVFSNVVVGKFPVFFAFLFLNMLCLLFVPDYWIYYLVRVGKFALFSICDRGFIRFFIWIFPLFFAHLFVMQNWKYLGLSPIALGIIRLLIGIPVIVITVMAFRGFIKFAILLGLSMVLFYIPYFLFFSPYPDRFFFVVTGKGFSPSERVESLAMTFRLEDEECRQFFKDYAGYLSLTLPGSNYRVEEGGKEGKVVIMGGYVRPKLYDAVVLVKVDSSSRLQDKKKKLSSGSSSPYYFEEVLLPRGYEIEKSVRKGINQDVVTRWIRRLNGLYFHWGDCCVERMEHVKGS